MYVGAHSWRALTLCVGLIHGGLLKCEGFIYTWRPLIV